MPEIETKALRASTAAIDPITVAVISSSLSTIADEMGKSIIRSAYSTNIKERHDTSTAVFDAAGSTLALAEHIPIHLGSLISIAKYVLDNNDISDLQPGDAYIGNDAYTGGGSHLNDWVLLEPVFYEDILVAWVANLAHHSDFVDRSHEHIFQEGLRIPPVRLYRAGVLQEDVQRLILLNCQVPRERLHDLRAQIAANRLGVKRYQALCDKFGAGTVHHAAQAALDSTERRTRAGLAQIPDGTYGFEEKFDTNFVDEPVNLKVVVKTLGGDIFFEFPYAPPQMKAPVNMVSTALMATIYFAVKALIDPQIPVNAGFYRPIHASAPENSVLNASAPAAVYSRTDFASRLVDMIFGALSAIVPERIAAASTGGTLLTTSGMHPRTGRFYVYNELHGGGMGARATMDGLDGVVVNTTNSGNLPIEALEMEHPIRVDSYEFVRDSGGPGQFRGGMTVRRQARIIDHNATISAGGTCSVEPPFGLLGGLPGSLSRVELPEGVSPLVKKAGHLAPGQWIGMVAAGGGGFGNPKDRDRAKVLDDLMEDRISRQAAIEIYGLSPNDIPERR